MLNIIDDMEIETVPTPILHIHPNSFIHLSWSFQVVHTRNNSLQFQNELDECYTLAGKMKPHILGSSNLEISRIQKVPEAHTNSKSVPFFP